MSDHHLLDVLDDAGILIACPSFALCCSCTDCPEDDAPPGLVLCVMMADYHLRDVLDVAGLPAVFACPLFLCTPTGGRRAPWGVGQLRWSVRGGPDQGRRCVLWGELRLEEVLHSRLLTLCHQNNYTTSR